MAPQTDIIVPVHDALEYTKACLLSIREHTKHYRLIIVDDYSSTETMEWLLDFIQFYAENSIALYIRTGQQKWFTRASNIGLRLVRTQRCVLMNSDCVVDEGWLEELYRVWDEAATQHPKIGLVGSHQSGEEPRVWSFTQNPGYVTGHCLMLSIPILSEMAEKRGQPGWYLSETDNSAIHINSDRYLSYELNAAGYGTVVSFKAAVGHHGGKSWGHNLGRIANLRAGDPLKGEVLG